MNNLSWLQSWYADQCNGEWEHSFGVSVTTLDNPGWALKINLAGTCFADLDFSPIERQREDDWLVCKITGKDFMAYGGPKNLDEMIEVFRTWVLNVEKKVRR